MSSVVSKIDIYNIEISKLGLNSCLILYMYNRIFNCSMFYKDSDNDKNILRVEFINSLHLQRKWTI